MHEEKAKSSVDKLLQADKVITTQQLGFLWTPPDLAALATALDDVGYYCMIHF